MESVPPQINTTKPILAVLVHVPKVEEAIAWYELALPGASRKKIYEPVLIEYLDLGGVMLEIVPSDEKVTNAAAGTIVYWNTPDFEASLLYLIKVGAVLYRGPLDIENGQRMCQLKDPWGNCFGLRGCTHTQKSS
jgi:predicted enzyme related to lactoylglutathione lyase